jgi:hypothetical protein
MRQERVAMEILCSPLMQNLSCDDGNTEAFPLKRQRDVKNYTIAQPVCDEISSPGV